MEKIWGGGERRGCRTYQACAKGLHLREPEVFAQDKVDVVECPYYLLKLDECLFPMPPLVSLTRLLVPGEQRLHLNSMPTVPYLGIGTELKTQLPDLLILTC